MSMLLVVAGLPGAGKTEYVSKLQRERTIDAVYDDYFATQLNETKDITINKNPYKNSRYFEIIRDLNDDKTVVVTDILFCISQHRNKFISAIIAGVQDVELEFVFFRVNPDSSKKNVSNRNRQGRVELEYDLIDKITAQATTVKTTEVESYDA